MQMPFFDDLDTKIDEFEKVCGVNDQKREGDGSDIGFHSRVSSPLSIGFSGL